MNFIDHTRQARELQIVGLLEAVCQSLEPTPSQTSLAKQRYEGVGTWLANSDDPALRSIMVYLQGSTAIGTAVRPIGFNEIDVDLVAHQPDLDVQLSPAAQKKAIGDRLRANGNYAPLLEEMPRCWRLNYADEFHMDITPSIPNPNCRFGGELVPDKTLKRWKPSNPKGYRRMFEERAKLVPVIRIRKHIAADSLRRERRALPRGGRVQGHPAPHRPDREAPPRHPLRRPHGRRSAVGDHHDAGFPQLRMVRQEPGIRQRARTASST